MNTLRLTLRHLDDKQSGWVAKIHVEPKGVFRKGTPLFEVVPGRETIWCAGEAKLSDQEAVVTAVHVSEGSVITPSSTALAIEYRFGRAFWANYGELRLDKFVEGSEAKMTAVLVKAGDVIRADIPVLRTIDTEKCMTIAAPVDGIATRVAVSLWQSVKPADPLLEFEDIPPELETELDASIRTASRGSGVCGQPLCGLENSRQAKFCARCGTPLG